MLVGLADSGLRSAKALFHTNWTRCVSFTEKFRAVGFAKSDGSLPGNSESSPFMGILRCRPAILLLFTPLCTSLIPIMPMFIYVLVIGFNQIKFFFFTFHLFSGRLKIISFPSNHRRFMCDSWSELKITVEMNRQKYEL